MATTLNLSSSVDGQPVAVQATTFTAIHSAPAGTTTWDQIYLYLSNHEAIARAVIVAWGTQVDIPNRFINSYTIPASSGLIAVVPGLILRNNLTVYVAGVGAGTINILASGYVIRLP